MVAGLGVPIFRVFTVPIFMLLLINGLLLNNICLMGKALNACDRVKDLHFWLFGKEIKQLTVGSSLKCLSIGTPKTINFPFGPNKKLMVLRSPNI